MVQDYDFLIADAPFLICLLILAYPKRCGEFKILIVEVDNRMKSPLALAFVPAFRPVLLLFGAPSLSLA